MGKNIDESTEVVDEKNTKKGFFGKTKDKMVKVMDQTGDGKFNMEDVSHIAGTVGGATKKAALAVKETADRKAREHELKVLHPIFSDDLTNADFSITKLVRICERDKKRAESEVCQGSIGYITDGKDLNVVNIYKEFSDALGIKYIPDKSYEFYYVDPCDRDRYIALDEYFPYLKKARINELEVLARSLGAKHFRVTYKEERASLTSSSEKRGVSVDKDAVSSEKSVGRNEFAAVEIAAEMDCAGHEPVVPELNYLKKDTDIQSLIELRMNTQSPIYHQHKSIKLSNSTGIKEKDAVKIDAVLKGLKCSGNSSVENEAKRESRSILEYEIDY